MNKESDLSIDSPLSFEQQKIVSNLSSNDIQKIDVALLLNTGSRWRKVAMVVGSTMIDFKNKYQDIPDIYFSLRIAYLVENGMLESRGDIRRMRYSEVRKVK